MELTYRGQHYQTNRTSTTNAGTNRTSATKSKLTFSCVYRGIPYQLTHPAAIPAVASETVSLIYRGTRYSRRFACASSPALESDQASVQPAKDRAMSVATGAKKYQRRGTENPGGGSGNNEGGGGS